MRNRCHNPNNSSYRLYGARGVTVCDRWQSFENFVADMGLRPVGMVIDRIDGNGDYEPTNCRWTTRRGNANNARTNIVFPIGGTRMTLKQVAEKFKIKYLTLYKRIMAGWDIGDAVFQPVRQLRSNRSN